MATPRDPQNDSKASRGALGGRVDLKSAVAQRTRELASAARSRIGVAAVDDSRGADGRGGWANASEAPRGPRAPEWLFQAVGFLPSAVQALLRDALRVPEPPRAPRPPQADDADDLSRQRDVLKHQREDLRLRESAVDAARLEQDRLGRLQDEARRELEAREREAERLLSEARRAMADGAVIRRVPLGQVRWRESDSPRPLRDIARLAANLRRFGQLTPVVARPEGDTLRLVTGFRRMAALKQGGFTHVDVRIASNLDDRLAAALYVADNCLPLGITSKAVAQLAARLGDDATPEMARVLAEIQADDESAVDEVYLEDLAEEARNSLGDAAAWIAALRPHWADLEPEDRKPLVELLAYMAKIAAKVGATGGKNTRP